MNAVAFSQLAYRLFLDPLPVWNHWLALLLPLTVAISIVYKAVRTQDLRKLPWEAAKTTFWILVGMAGAAAGLALLVKVFSFQYA